MAVVGCGAVAEIHHVRALASSERIALAVLVDNAPERAQRLAHQYQSPAVATNYRDIVGKVDAAVVALPNYLHAPVTSDLLRSGIHVLVEKPMALRLRDCEEMIEAGRSAGSILAVALDFRFVNALQFTKRLLEQGVLGSICNFDVRLGVVFDWPSVSGAVFNKEVAGGGVLVDFGVHILDLLLWWLGDYEEVEFYDDAVGGVEADCELHLRLKSRASGFVELSRTRQLRNTCIIQGERGTLEVGVWEADPEIRLQLPHQDLVLNGRAMLPGTGDQTWRDVFRRQLDDFVNAIGDNREPFVPGSEGKRAIALIDACYASRQRLTRPWDTLDV